MIKTKVKLVTSFWSLFVFSQTLFSQAINLGTPQVAPSQKRTPTRSYSPPPGITKRNTESSAKSSIPSVKTQVRWYNQTGVNLVLSSEESGTHSYYIKPDIFNEVSIPVGVFRVKAKLPRFELLGEEFLFIEKGIILVELWMSDDNKTVLFQTFTEEEYKQHQRNQILEKRQEYLNQQINPYIKAITLSSTANNLANLEKVKFNLDEMSNLNLISSDEKIAANTFLMQLKSLIGSYNELKLALSYNNFFDNPNNFGYISKVIEQLKLYDKSSKTMGEVWTINPWEEILMYSINRPISNELKGLPKTQIEFKNATDAYKKEQEKIRAENQRQIEQRAAEERRKQEELRLAEEYRQKLFREQELERQRKEQQRLAEIAKFYKHSGALLGFNFGMAGYGLWGFELGKVYNDSRVGILGFVNFTDSLKHKGVLQMGVKSAVRLQDGLYLTGQFFGGFLNQSVRTQYSYWNGWQYVNYYGSEIRRRPMGGLGIGVLYNSGFIYGGASVDYMSNFNGEVDITPNSMFKLTVGCKIGY